DLAAMERPMREALRRAAVFLGYAVRSTEGAPLASVSLNAVIELDVGVGDRTGAACCSPWPPPRLGCLFVGSVPTSVMVTTSPHGGTPVWSTAGFNSSISNLALTARTACAGPR